MKEIIIKGNTVTVEIPELDELGRCSIECPAWHEDGSDAEYGTLCIFGMATGGRPTWSNPKDRDELFLRPTPGGPCPRAKKEEETK